MGMLTHLRIYCIILTLVSVMGFWGGEVRGQISTQNFGTGTGSYSNTAGSTIFIPNPTSGTTWTRGGGGGTAPVNLVTASNPLGTADAYVRAVASNSASVSKFSPMVAYSGSTEFYTSFKVLFGDASAGITATSGIWSFYQGAGTMYSDAGDFDGSMVFTGLRFTFSTGGALLLTYRGGSSWINTNLTTTTFSSAIVYTIEIIGNNKSTGTISYTYNGNALSVAVQKFDLYINGTLVGDDLAEAQLPANTPISSNTFTGINSTSNVANIFVDDVVVYNAVPASITTNFPALSLSPATLTGFTYLQGSGPSAAQTYTLSGTNLIGFPGNITVTGSNNYEVSTDNSTFSGSLSVPYTTGTIGNTTIYVRLKGNLSANIYNNELIKNAGGGATTMNVSCSGSVTSGSNLVVISQVYGGGGNTGAIYKNDFIELYNRGTTSVDISGWSVQYASSSGTNWQATNLASYTLAPGQYYLVQEASAGSVGSSLPTADVNGGISMSSSAGKVALVYNTTPLSGSCPTGVNIIDFVGYGAANCYEGAGPTTSPNNTTSVFRAAGGCQDTDHNVYDFAVEVPSPRNTLTTIATCPLIPTLVLYNANITGLTYTFGSGPSASQIYRLSGKYLTGFPGNILVTGSSNYWVSLDGTNFFASVSVPYSSATLGWTPIYVRLISGLAINTYNNEIISNAGGGATTLNVICNGSVTAVSPCPSGLPLYENFNYTTGTTLTSNCWATHSTSVPPNSISVAAGSIIYPCYQSSGIGNEVSLTTSGDDVNIAFTQRNSGSIFASFLVNVTSSQATGDYFFHLIATPINTVFQGRIFIKKDPSSTNFAFGLVKGSSGTPVYTGYNYAPLTTCLVVLKYTFISGLTNDVVSLYVNPFLSTTEPTPLLTASDGTTDLSNAGFIALRQGTGGSAPSLKLDGIRVSTNWADIATPTTPAITAADETAAVCFSANEQTTSLAYSDATGNPISYNIDWEDAANSAGLLDQPNTAFTFLSGGGILTGISITANTPAGTYNGTISLKNITGCTGSQAIKVTVNAIPTIVVTPSGEVICSGGSVLLTASEGTTYSWSPTTGLNQSTGAVVTASPVSTTNYIVTGTTNSCSADATVTVTININNWLGGTADWNTPANWSCISVPGPNTDIIIPNGTVQPIISSTYQADCRNIEIQSGATLTIQSDAASSGSLIMNGVFSGTGNVIYNRYLENNRWYITSSPVSNSFSLNGSTIGSKDNKIDFAPYVEENNLGWDYVADIPTTLNPGQGYLLKLAAGNTVQYTGVPNGDLSFSLPSSGPDDGWNAIGNPYPSSMRIKDVGSKIGFLTQNTTVLDPYYQAVYLWNQTGPYTAGLDQYYCAINNAGYYPVAIRLYNGPLSDSLIQAGQGFLVNINYGGGTIKYMKGSTGIGMQVHSPTATTMKSRETNTSWPGITLLATNNGRTRSTIVAFNKNMTSGLDPSYDAGLLSTSGFNLYTHLLSGGNETDFTIQCLPENMYDSLDVPVGIDLPQAGQLTFKAAGVILPEGLYPVLEDRLLQRSTPLETDKDSVTINMTEPTWGTGRFYLHIRGVSNVGNTKLPEIRKFTARFADQKITIYGAAERGSRAWLYDLSGRKLGGEYGLVSANQNEMPAKGLANGIYLLRIEGKTGRQTLKITILNR